MKPIPFFFVAEVMINQLHRETHYMGGVFANGETFV
jgi:hypothetical protein